MLGDDLDLVSDMSWGQVDTRVLRVMAGTEHFVVKAAGPSNHHIGREISAHETATGPLLSRDLCARLVGVARGSNILVTTFVRGELVEGTPAELSPEVQAQAGALLRAFHSQSARLDDEYEARVTHQALQRLSQDHRIPYDIEDRAREILNGYSPHPILVVPTHGDWQPRNWVFDGTKVRVIDFGRFDYRPAATDLCRLAVQQWRSMPSLEIAFMSGYVDDPRDPEVWGIDLLREAVGTAVWAHRVGDEPFEQQGQRMLREALQHFV
ncbi:MAG: aminoglycoside phosphotransferase [Microbacterium sp. SCN 69-37]|nr:MAG: aminoglycoside phosphotransferase [Microbacterium sp. SCN 69-37]